jgi:hypothetical protein
MGLFSAPARCTTTMSAGALHVTVVGGGFYVALTADGTVDVTRDAVTLAVGRHPPARLVAVCGPLSSAAEARAMASMVHDAVSLEALAQRRGVAFYSDQLLPPGGSTRAYLRAMSAPRSVMYLLEEEEEDE